MDQKDSWWARLGGFEVGGFSLCVSEHTFCTHTYLFQELNSVPQTLHLLCHVLHQAEPSSCRNHTNADVYHQKLTMEFKIGSVREDWGTGQSGKLWLILSQSITQRSPSSRVPPSPPLQRFMATAMSRNCKLESGLENLGHRKGDMDIMDQPKNQRHQLEERSPEIDRHSLIRPVNMHLVRGKCLLGSTLGECPRIRRDPGFKMRSPLLSGHTFCRQTWSSPISPRCGLLLRQAWVEKQGEEGEVEEGKRRRGRGAMTPSRQSWWSWNENISVGQKRSEKKGKGRVEKGVKWRRMHVVQHSSTAALQGESKDLRSEHLNCSVHLWHPSDVSIWIHDGRQLSADLPFLHLREQPLKRSHTHKENTLCGSFILAIHPPFVCVLSCFFADSEKLGGLSVGVMGVSSFVWADDVRVYRNTDK